VLAARHERDLGAGTREQPSDETADSTRSDHGDAHSDPPHDGVCAAAYTNEFA
jgi:hypothetical protein